MPVSWQGIIYGIRRRAYFIHEKLNEVEMKAYFDLLYQAGAKNVVYADESVKGIPKGTPWEDVIWGMKNTYKNLQFCRGDYEGTAHGLSQIFAGGAGREL